MKCCVESTPSSSRLRPDPCAISAIRAVEAESRHADREAFRLDGADAERLAEPGVSDGQSPSWSGICSSITLLWSVLSRWSRIRRWASSFICTLSG